MNINDSKNRKNGNFNSSADINSDMEIKRGNGTQQDNEKPFTRINFYMMGACVAMIILGFILMSGGGSDDPAAFNPDIFSTRRIVVGPAISFLGFLLMAFAIIYTPSKKEKK